MVLLQKEELDADAYASGGKGDAHEIRVDGEAAAIREKVSQEIFEKALKQQIFDLILQNETSDDASGGNGGAPTIGGQGDAAAIGGKVSQVVSMAKSLKKQQIFDLNLKIRLITIFVPLQTEESDVSVYEDAAELGMSQYQVQIVV